MQVKPRTSPSVHDIDIPGRLTHCGTGPIFQKGSFFLGRSDLESRRRAHIQSPLSEHLSMMVWPGWGPTIRSGWEVTQGHYAFKQKYHLPLPPDVGQERTWNGRGPGTDVGQGRRWAGDGRGPGTDVERT